MSQSAGATLPSISIKEVVVSIVHALNAVGVNVDENSGVLLQEDLREYVRAKLAETQGPVESSDPLLKVTETSQASQALTEEEEYRVKEFNQGHHHLDLDQLEDNDLCDCYFKYGMDDDMGEVRHYGCDN